MVTRVVSVVVTAEVRGSGTLEDPIRTVTQLYDLDGRLLAEWEPVPGPRGNGRATPELGSLYWRTVREIQGEAG